MTDKQIIIDGLACVNCPEAKRCQEQQAKKEYAINQVLQGIPTEYANVIARLKQIIPSVTRCDYVLEKQLKAKEQECERLRFPMLDTNYAILTKEEFEQLDQLKAENEILEKDKANLAVITETLKVQFKQLEQTLEEINSLCYEQDLNEDFFACEVLQKIKECEVDK